MPGEDIVDPRVVPRWVEAGVSGVPRGREWDVVAVVEVPELEGSQLSELAFARLADGRVGSAGGELPPAALERLSAAVEESLEPPYEARALRRGTREWSVAGRTAHLQPVAVPPSLPADALVLAVGPDGERLLFADGEEQENPSAALAAAAAELERRGRERYPSFVARAERLAPGFWVLTVDPL
jgi:hypothetical protein